jgi:hypothetical protein
MLRNATDVFADLLLQHTDYALISFNEIYKNR